MRAFLLHAGLLLRVIGSLKCIGYGGSVLEEPLTWRSAYGRDCWHQKRCPELGHLLVQGDDLEVRLDTARGGVKVKKVPIF